MVGVVARAHILLPSLLLLVHAWPELSVGHVMGAATQATCKFFRVPAGFPPDVSLGLTEMAALDACMQRPTFRAMPPAVQRRVMAACGGTWKLLLRFMMARERCTRSAPAPLCSPPKPPGTLCHRPTPNGTLAQVQCPVPQCTLCQRQPCFRAPAGLLRFEF